MSRASLYSSVSGKIKMKTASAKAKGRNLQKYVCAQILAAFPSLEPDDVVSKSMGAGGEDVMLSPAARKYLPVSIECKNVQKLNIWTAWAQAKANAKNYFPVLIFKRNNHETLVTITLEYFLELEANQKGK